MGKETRVDDPKGSTHVRMRKDKKPRIERVRRKLSAIEDRDWTDIDLVDEILEEGLSKREKKLGLI